MSTVARRESSLLSATQQKVLGTVVIFRIQLLPPSETFIVSQAAAMQQFSPYFVGWRKVAGIKLPAETSWTIDGGSLQGKLRELRFRYAGPSREQLARLQARSARLVYAHFAPDGYAAMQLADRLGVPLVTALHGFDVTMTDQAIGATRLGREYLRGRSALQKMGALFVACSDFVRGRALELGYPAERTIVHSIGTDIETFKPPGARAAAENRSLCRPPGGEEGLWQPDRCHGRGRASRARQPSWWSSAVAHCFRTTRHRRQR